MKLKLLLFEDAAINDELDQLAVRNIILDVISGIKGPLGFTSDAKITELLNSIIQAIKTDEFKAVVKTKEFQELYCIAESYAGTKLDYIAKECGKQELPVKTLLNNIGRTRAWRKFINLDLTKIICDEHQLLSALHNFLLEDIEARFLFQHKYENYFFEIYPFRDITSSIDFNVCDKTFNIDLTCFSDQVIRLYLEENLKYDNFKNTIIYETIKLSKEACDTKFLEENEVWLVLLCLTSLYDFIYKRESVLFNYYFEQRGQNNSVYQSFVERSSSQRIAVEDLFLFCVLAGSSVKDMRNFYNNNYSAIWHSYFKTQMHEKGQQDVGSIANKLRRTLARSFGAEDNTAHSPAQAVDACPSKKKFPYKKNLLGALAWKKAEKTGRPYIDVFREAAEEWLDEEGNEIAGEQLANNFYNSAKNHGGPQNFFDAKEKQLTIIKKKIKWKE